MSFDARDMKTYSTEANKDLIEQALTKCEEVAIKRSDEGHYTCKVNFSPRIARTLKPLKKILQSKGFRVETIDMDLWCGVKLDWHEPLYKRD